MEELSDRLRDLNVSGAEAVAPLAEGMAEVNIQDPSREPSRARTAPVLSPTGLERQVTSP